jgi:hypothetical protein
MRSLLVLLLFTPVLMGSTCKASYSSDEVYVEVCNAPGPNDGCTSPGTHPPASAQAASVASDSGPVALPSPVAASDDALAAARGASWRPVASHSTGGAALARAIPEPSAALGFGLGWLGLVWRLRARRR